MVKLKLHDQLVKIDEGELVGYSAEGHEYIHQKGSPGWRNSDTEMFPIIGPTNEANFRVTTPKGAAVQDQHGLLREMAYQLVSQTETKAIFRKQYVSGTPIKNSKYPSKSTEEYLSWPYNFEFTKSFEISENGLRIQFKITAEEDMPFMLGYHPAFKLTSERASIKTAERTIALQEVLDVGSRALPVMDCNSLTLVDVGELIIKTEGFGNFMLWTEVPNMLCIEPITFYPYAVSQKKLHSGFQPVNRSENIFSVIIQPNI
ncbi:MULTISPECIES: aldose epimerase family protein [Arenibacter]|uniref:aldose epimerase family protein n=1 Tax=Arenibacter TaxID=178469 RepID=UPI0004DEED4D|nr:MULTISPECIES: aldose epimerase [Arenibacter]GBF18767.1 aldose 1-epimerase [Arenibacter sp. NBRC 103722]